ncbi:MAG: NAD(+)/NADH kinase [Coriobacteriia bacterium]|nr:NAD(+)/NADH kinase [Coriobacteriia bacterium]
MKVLLFSNTTKDPTAQALQAMSEWLEAKGISYDLFSSGIFEEQDSRFSEFSAAITNYDLVCSFGGDGTTLRAAHLVGRAGIPLLSYNFGRLGFLSGATVDDLIPALQAALNGQLSFDARSLLDVAVTYEDGHTDHQIAVNELAVSRGHFGRIVELDLAINGTYITSVKGDGILVATPTGSTGYALSAGGPIISPAHEGLCVVPISPHSLTSRAIVTTRNDVVGIVPNQQNRQQLVLFIDGEVFWIPSTTSNEPRNIEVSVCPEKLLLARFGPYDFYDHISRTFFRGTHA